MKKGETVIITQGEYSDYAYTGIFKVLKDFSFKKEREVYNNTLPMVEIMSYGERVPEPARHLGTRWVRYNVPVPTGRFRRDYPSVDGFQTYLTNNKFLKEIDVVDYHYDYPGEVD